MEGDGDGGQGPKCHRDDGGLERPLHPVPGWAEQQQHKFSTELG